MYPGEEIRYEQCEMCGNEKNRYVHNLPHPEIGELRYGRGKWARLLKPK